MVKWFLSDDDSNIILDHLEDFNLASWYAVVLSVGFWAITYYAIRFTFSNKSPEWCIRVVALFHGLGAVIRGIPECVTDNGDWIFECSEDDTTRSQMLVMIISLGYFIFDLGWCLAYESETNLMIFHHCYSCVALYRVLISEVAGGQTACGLAAMEMTNPLLQLRWFLRSEGYYNTPIFKGVELTFIFLFFIVRIIFGTYFFGLILSNSSNTYEQKLFGALMYILSWVFFANIVKFIYLKYIQQIIQTTDELTRRHST